MTVESKLIDHILLSPDAATRQIEDLRVEARKYDFCPVYISPYQVGTTVRCSKGNDVRVYTVTGFPSGAHVTGIKSAEAKQAVADGTQEVDVVVNVGAVKEGNWEYVKNDIAAVVEAAGKGALVEVTLGICLFADEGIAEACKYAQTARTDFVKISTGFSKARATAEAVTLMRKTVGDTMGVKVTGRIRTPEAFRAMVAAGVSRIGASTRIKLIGGTQ